MEQLTKNQAVATSQEAVQNQNEPQLRDENAHNDKSVHGVFNFFSRTRRHTRFDCDWSSDVCSSDLVDEALPDLDVALGHVLQAGKSTALRMLAGLEDVTEGDIKIGERLVNDVPARERDIAMVFQSRSEEGRVGKERRSRWWPYHYKK